ncbi:uncharacterized protein LOC129718107 [Wyeomyia smithii]|uniref:uncharacterized protein LOC129718107 n=1 Tax=Wyeomyia smithii TaxID=174621 RepID=UPI002467E0CC|nr:uncharacterized protein LOC129718107 [Wyeomyia smithii]
MDILHPHMLSKQQLLAIFHQRHFHIPRLEELSRDELIELYSKHLLPLPRRGSRPNNQSSDVEMKDTSRPTSSSKTPSPNVRQRIVYSETASPPETVDNVSHGVKKIRLVSPANGVSLSTTQNQPSNGKRRLPEVSPSRGVNCAPSRPLQTSSKRQKITWP